MLTSIAIEQFLKVFQPLILTTENLRIHYLYLESSEKKFRLRDVKMLNMSQRKKVSSRHWAMEII